RASRRRTGHQWSGNRRGGLHHDRGVPGPARGGGCLGQPQHHVRPRVTRWLAMLAVAAVAHAAGPKAGPAPDYFPLHEHDIWRYRSTNARGAASNFVVTVAAAEKGKDGSPSFQTQTLVEGKRILDWYAKPQGWVVHLSQFPMGAPRATEF